MGCGSSALVETPENFDRFSLTFHWIDTLRLVHASPRILGLVKKAILNNWDKGLGDIINNKGAIDIDVKGRPFAKGSDGEGMLCHLLEYLLADGWCLDLSADLSRTIDYTTWFFKQYARRKPTGKPIKIAAVSLRGTEDLHLIKGGQTFFDAIKRALAKKYPQGIQKEMDAGGGEYHIRMQGNPWISENHEGMDARRFVLQMIRELQEVGWFFYGTANCKGTADCMFFIYHADGDGWIEPADDYCMLSLNQNDRLRVLDADAELNGYLKKTIELCWGKGRIQKEGEFNGAYEFKLKGEPWCSQAQDVVYSRYLVIKLLETMAENGWHLFHAVDMTRKMNDKAVLIFKKGPVSKLTYWGMVPAEMDKIRVIAAPASVLETIRNTLLRYYPNGISSENPDFHSCHEFKLSGMPWYGRQGNDELFIRSFLLFLFKKLESDGWRAVSAMDVSAKHIRTDMGPDYPLDVHSIFLVKDPSVQRRRSTIKTEKNVV